jgi:hypothetical protein
MLCPIADSTRYLDTLSKRWWQWAAILYSPQYHIFWRDQGYMTQSAANGKPVFWGPGEAWVLGGLSRVLKYMPVAYAKRDSLARHLREQCAAIVPLQQGDGLWTTSLLDSVAFPDHETSCTAFFCFAMAWGINNGVLDKATFEQPMRKAWSGLVRSVSAADGRLQRCQGVSSAPGTVGVSNSSAEGEGGFLLAGEEMYKYVTGQVGAKNINAPVMKKSDEKSARKVIRVAGQRLNVPESVKMYDLYGRLIDRNAAVRAAASGVVLIRY